MTATMNPSALFQHYVQNIFKFPKEIKNDIVYCQRALKTHIKVHQMVLDVYKTQLNPDPVQKKRIIDELETQIYEINAEQQFLLLLLRRSIDDFYKTLSKKGALIIPELMNELISSELVPLINDQSILIYPMSVRLRCSEEKLIEKYFEVKHENQNNYFEILDSDEEEQNKMSTAKSNSSISMPMSSYKRKKTNAAACKSNALPYNFESIYKKQISLLKPMSQRLEKKEPQPASLPSLSSSTDTTFIDASQFVEVMDGSAGIHRKSFKTPSSCTSNTNNSMMKSKVTNNSIAAYPVNIQASKTGNEKEREDLCVSKNVKMSRLNLRQALKKAHTETLAAAKAAVVTANTGNSHLGPLKATPQLNVGTSTSKKLDQRTRVARRSLAGNTAINLSAMKPIEVNSSSGDSTPERSLTPPQQLSSSAPTENVDTRIKPEDYGQELFLRMFGLFTPEMRLHMQQRRSKRKRRTVQNNARSDYHYGHIEYGTFPPPPPEDKKKRKAFLLSPQQTKRAKSDGSTPSRSSSSSPDEKRCCNECLKPMPSIFERCEDCKGYYHQYCHREQDDLRINNWKTSLAMEKIKLCPSCKRLQARSKNKTEAKQFQSLQTTAKKLEQKIMAEKNRHMNLKKESETFKSQMNTLYNIVKAIKSDPDNSD